ncbi:Hypothetical protein HVR_LOCUS171 [uncultured virus]|nr:Hypothetical protein HVR_LOCUS171 [uncultured virus]
MLHQQHRLVSFDSLSNDISNELNNNTDGADTSMLPQNDRVLSYYAGGGPLGDFISAYYIPRAGPWFFEPTTNSTNRLENFIQSSTMFSSLNDQEQIVSDRLSQIWNIPYSGTVVVKQPAILNGHYTFVQTDSSGSLTRQLFLDQYNMVDNVAHVMSDIDNISFTQTGTGGSGAPIYNIDADGQTITDVRLAWRTSPFKYFQTATVGGLNPRDIMAPITYRSVIPIRLGGTGNTGFTGCSGFTGHSGCSGRFNCCWCWCDCDCSGHSGHTGLTGCSGQTGFTGPSGGVDLNGLSDLGDLLTTHITFSLPDIGKSRASSPLPLGWLASAYTTPEDLSVTEPGGRYANEGFTFLIIEALSVNNRRRLRYSNEQNQIQISYNHPVIETSYARQFARIAASVYHAYTGLMIPADALLPSRSVCSPGQCTDSDYVIDYTRRESPMESVLGLASTLYGQNIYPSPSDSVTC